MTQQRSGVLTQVDPVDVQLTGAEVQVPMEEGVLPVISEPDRTTPPIPGGTPRSPLPAAVGSPELQELESRAILGGLPILFLNRYVGSDTSFVELVRWDVPEGLLGDLHEVSLSTDNGSKTRYRIVIANREMSIPDREVSTLINLAFRKNTIPGGTSVILQVRSTDGTEITVDGSISGSEQ